MYGFAAPLAGSAQITASHSRRRIGLIQKLECKLDQTRRVDLVADDPELWRPQRKAGIAESHPVEDVKELAPELQVEAAVTIEAVILDQAHIQIVSALIASVRQGPAGVAESESGRLAKHAGIEKSV